MQQNNSDFINPQIFMRVIPYKNECKHGFQILRASATFVIESLGQTNDIKSSSRFDKLTTLR